MSVVIAKKTKKGFVLGCDTIAIKGQMKNQATKIFRDKNDSDIICGVVGSLRDLNILSVTDDIIDGQAIRREIVDTDNMITSTVKNIKNKLKEEGRLYVDKEAGEVMQSSVIIAYKNKCWVIGHDFAVSEVDDFAAIGAPEEFASGAYEIIASNEIMSDEDKVTRIIEACIKRTIYVNYPICIAHTDGKDIKVITDARR